jgi:outer membrane protein assembly factor BamD
MVNKTRIAALLLLPVILLPATGCARNKVKGDTAYVARDVNTLYSLAKEKVDKGDY